MTREEANARRVCCPLCDKKKCEREAHDCDVKNYLKDELAKKLDQKPCEDAVSREQVQNLIAELLSEYLHEEDRTKIENMDAEIGDLPPATPTPKWIPCSERLPNESGKYWCTFGGTNLMGIDFYTTESYAKKWFDEPEEYIGWESKNVSAWMPLPEPYKEESEDKE